MMIDMLFSWGRYWRLTMSPEEKEKLKHFKEINVREGTPEDLRKVIETFIQQAIIVGEYELDSMPPEYMENLLQTMSKYPEYNNVTLSLMEILKREDLI